MNPTEQLRTSPTESRPQAPPDWDSFPSPPLATKVHLAYVGIVAALCIWGVLISLSQAVLLVAVATAIRFALVGWIKRREYEPWIRQRARTGTNGR